MYILLKNILQRLIYLLCININKYFFFENVNKIFIFLKIKKEKDFFNFILLRIKYHKIIFKAFLEM